MAQDLSICFSQQSALAPAMPLVIAGSGPLLLLIAVQLHRAGIEISAVLDTTPKGRYRKALKSVTTRFAARLNP
ncbi:hypothetical protein [Oceanospirillum sediminis]|uniref:Uncharacterized protein n=1 Tax=Oceanospirillum sediminis TaxID=2760088 RepID=A0A839IVB4_9GAMM|nr:hypothetical protein [Oceanospirillum sediminis]MBB1488056.1 hypothetical protein [Oceanospirillum sediminis]